MTVDWYKAAQCAMRNKNKSLPEIAAAMEAEQPEESPPEMQGKSFTRWAGLNTNGVASLECDTGWGGRGEFDATLLAIFEDRADAEERYSGVAQVTITLAE